MSQKNVLITGASSGIGKHTAFSLAGKGMKVIMAARNVQKAEKAKKEIIAKHPRADLDVLHCDLASFQSVRTFAEKVREEIAHLDVIINNAAAFYSGYGETEDGFERQWQVNYLSHFLLTHLLFDLIDKSPRGRIINVSSSNHHGSRIDFADPNLRSSYNGLTAYGQSKLANVMFTNALAGRLDPGHITVNSVHPGSVRTAIGTKNLNILFKLIWLSTFFYRESPHKGAEGPVFLASDPSVEGITGTYFNKKTPCSPHRIAENREYLEKLWKLSLTQTGMEDKITTTTARSKHTADEHLENTDVNRRVENPFAI